MAEDHLAGAEEKVKIFEIRRNEAERQIDLKLCLLKHWVLNGIPWQISSDGAQIRDADGELLLDYTPKTISDFAAWTAACHSPGTRQAIIKIKSGDSEQSITLADLATLSRTTLNQPYREQLKTSIDVQLKAICQKAIAQIESTRKVALIEALKVEKAFLESVVASQETELRRARIDARKAKVELEEAKRIASNNEAELKRLNTELESKLASMVREMSKISQLRVQRDSDA